MTLTYFANIALPDDWAHTLQIMKMCEAFADSGVKVELVVPNRKKVIKDSPFDYYGVKKTFSIVRMPSLSFSETSPGKFVYWSRFLSYLFVARIRFLLRPSSIIYTRERLLGLLFGGYVLELHSLPKLNAWNRFLLRRAKKFVVLTKPIKERLVAIGISESKILVAGDAVSLEDYKELPSKNEARTKFGLPLDKKIVGYVGTLKTMGMEKGITVAIDALHLLPPDYLLCLVGGEKDDVDFYRKLADQYYLGGRVIFVGKVHHERVPLYLTAFDCVIAPFPDLEHYRYFMSPLKIFEYMASGRPIIVSDLPSIREILDENSAIFVKPNDKDSLAEAIKKILGDAALSERLSSQAIVNVREHTWNKRSDRIKDFIKR